MRKLIHHRIMPIQKTRRDFDPLDIPFLFAVFLICFTSAGEGLVHAMSAFLEQPQPKDSQNEEE